MFVLLRLITLLFIHSAKNSRKVSSYSTLIGDKAPPAERDSSEVARTFNRRYCAHIGSDGHSWGLTTSMSLSVGFSIQDEAMDVARSAPLPCGRYLLVSLAGNKEGPNGTLSKAYINSVPDQRSLYPVRQNALAFYTKRVSMARIDKPIFFSSREMCHARLKPGACVRSSKPIGICLKPIKLVYLKTIWSPQYGSLGK